MSLSQDQAEMALARLLDAATVLLSMRQHPGGDLHAARSLKARDDVYRVAGELTDAVRAQPVEEQPGGWELVP